MTMRFRQEAKKRRACQNNLHSHYLFCSSSQLAVVFLCLCGIAGSNSKSTPPNQNDGANGLLDVLWKLQENLRQRIEGSQSTPSQPSPTSPPSRQNKNPSDGSGNYRSTHRRGLFEHTLQTHYSTYLPHALDNHNELHPHRAKEGDGSNNKESWTDPRTKCILFNEDASAYWTYHWCPKSYVTQVHLQPKSLNFDGSVAEWAASSMHRLGNYVREPEDATLWYNAMGAIDSNSDMEFYSNGDSCHPSRDLTLRQSKKRRSLVVYNKECRPLGNELLSIISVLEPSPCQYILTVCQRPESNTTKSTVSHRANDTGIGKKKSLNEGTEGNTPMEGAHDNQSDGLDELQRIKDIQKVVEEYSYQSGIDRAIMTVADKTTTLKSGLPPFPASRKQANLRMIREMFAHAYDSYLYRAFPASELKPVTCRPGTFSLVKLPALTLVDTLDTFIVLKNFTEFARSVERLRMLHHSLQQAEEDETGKKRSLAGGGLFAANQNVSVFETNIRVLGGLLSAHQLAVIHLSDSVFQEDVFDENGQVKFGRAPERTEPKTTCEDKSTNPSCGRDSKHNQDCSIPSTQSYTRGAKQAEEQDKTKCKNSTSSRTALPHWKYDGFLLELALDIGKRLLPAFSTKTGIPYGTVNLISGIPRGETTIASLAGGGTLSLEFELLSRLTGDPSFGKAAKLATRALWMRRSKLNLMGKHINIERGEWTETLSGVGSNSDSFYEYLVKHFTVFPEDRDFWTMFKVVYNGVQSQSRLGEWYADVDMNVGITGASRHVFESLMAFFPGVQVLLGELGPAAKTLNSFLTVREFLGLLPERFNYGQWRVDGLPSSGAGLHPLRPELIESCYFLHKATQGMSLERNSSGTNSLGWLWAADYALHTLHWHTWTKCGYSAVKDISPQATGGLPTNQGKTQKPRFVNEMPSFFLSETLKYFYLLFDDDNILDQDEERHWVFTTEAHPIHYVPKPDGLTNSVPSRDQKTKSLRTQMRDFLRERLSKPSPKPKRKSPAKAALDVEKWSARSLSSAYARDISDAESESTKVRRNEQRNYTEAYHLFNTSFIQPHVVAFDGDQQDQVVEEDPSQEATNLAYLSIGGSGGGLMLQKACANVYSTSLLWINALNGGAIDYGIAYVTSVNDNIPVDHVYGVGMLSALHALSLHGSGLYLGRTATASGSCSIEKSVASTKTYTSRTVPETPQRFDMGGEMGSFDVSIFADGNGFSIRSLKTGEIAVITVVKDETNKHNLGGPYVMVHTNKPAVPPRQENVDEEGASSWPLSGIRWKAVFNRRQGDGSAPDDGQLQLSEPERNVVISNNLGKSFQCKVQILRRTTLFGGTPGRTLPWVEDQLVEFEDLEASFPCAPALFGPTVISSLATTNGLTSEGILLPPDPSDSMGCLVPNSSVEKCSDQRIMRAVLRGDCTFQSKASNQRRREGAEGVIVINSDTEELFLMANGTDLADDSVLDIPVSVLVTGGDGAEMIRLQEQFDGSGPDYLIARISITPQDIEIDEKGVIVSKSGPLEFPLVKVTKDAIQIFAKGGWGVHAMDRTSQVQQHKSNQNTPQREWQLFLLQHQSTKS